jgi:hypothetical protein
MKAPLILSLLTYGLYRLSLLYTESHFISLLVLLIPVGLLAINFLIRGKLKYRNWFMSKRNILLDREEWDFHSDIEADLLFEKIKSVVNSSSFKLLDEDKEERIILASTSVSFFSWGENIYIEIHPEIEQVVVTSVTIFGSYSWNRNRGNYDDFFQSFEASLTI